MFTTHVQNVWGESDVQSMQITTRTNKQRVQKLK